MGSNRRKRLLVAGVVLGASAVGWISSGAPGFSATAPSTGVPPPAAPLSGYETSGRGLIAGDEGVSVALPNGQDLWIRGDTPYYVQHDGNYTLTYTLHGSSAAEGPYTPGLVPRDLAELPTPPRVPTTPLAAPQRFLRNPTDLYQPGTTKSCASAVEPYADSMVTGAALDPATYSRALGYDTDVLVTYDEICVNQGHSAGVVEGWGVAEYNWALNSFDSQTEVFAPLPGGAPLPLAAGLGSPVIVNGEVYLYSSVCDQSAYGFCVAGRVFGAEVADDATDLTTRGSYRFFTPATGQFVSDPTAASAQSASLVSQSPTGPWSVSVGNYSAVPGYQGQGLEMVILTDLWGDYEVWQSTSPLGPWTAQTSGDITSCLNTPKGAFEFCYALYGHPELSTGSSLMLSYYTPTYVKCPNACSATGYVRHIVDIGVPW